MDGGSGSDGDRTQQSGCGESLATAAAEGAGELRVRNQPIDTLAQSGGVRHRNHAGMRMRGGCETQQQLGVAEPVAAGGDGGAVADGLTEPRELRTQPPGERADPEEAEVKSRGQLQVEVAFADVFGFMRERGAQRGVVPLNGIERQQDAVANGGGRAQIDRQANWSGDLASRERLRASPEAGGEHQA
jgi:hypothetical protein